jgi:hypothetical protein
VQHDEADVADVQDLCPMFQREGPELGVWGQQVNPTLARGFTEDLAAIGFTDPVLSVFTVEMRPNCSESDMDMDI